MTSTDQHWYPDDTLAIQRITGPDVIGCILAWE